MNFLRKVLFVNNLSRVQYSDTEILLNKSKSHVCCLKLGFAKPRPRRTNFRVFVTSPDSLKFQIEIIFALMQDYEGSFEFECKKMLIFLMEKLV